METTKEITEGIVDRLRPLAAPHPKTDSETVTTYVCYGCGESITRKGPTERRGYTCLKCVKRDRLTRFNKWCPELYRESDVARLPKVQLEQAMRWEYGPRGIIFLGDTGKGKSRIAWKLLHRVLVEDKKDLEFLWFDCVSFGHEIVKHYRLETAEVWLDRVAEVPLLFFDDLGKLKLTERAETELFGVIERRCANRLPIIATTNDTGDSLAARLTENRGPAMIRRLREFCEIVTF